MPLGPGFRGAGFQLTNALFTLFSFIFLSVRDNQTRFGAFVNLRLSLKISELVVVNLGSYVKRF